MVGVEILNAKEVIVGYDANGTAIFVAAAVAFSLAVLLCICRYYADEGPIVIFIGAIFGILIAFVAALSAYAITRTPLYETQYEVTVSDSVNVNEFTEKYEVIDTRGKIFTVREQAGNTNT